MLTHFFKLIWNKKKQNFLLLTEILVAFLVVFGIFSSLVFYYNNYKRPAGFDHEKVWTINFSDHKPGTKNKDSLEMIYKAIRQRLLAMPEVKDVAYASYNTPFSANVNGGDAKYKGRSYGSDWFYGDDHYDDVLKVQMVAGRWFSEKDNGARNPPVVINETLKNEMFGSEDPIGKEVEAEDAKRTIIGVVADLKERGDYASSYKGFYQRADTSFYDWVGVMLMRVNPSADASFESRLYTSLTGMLKGASVEIEHMEDKRVAKNKQTIVPMIVAMVIGGFLIINVALGLFGVLWYNISRRRQEIGLRRAIGATAGNVSTQIISETLVLTTLSLILGLFFAVQFPLMHVFDLPAQVYIWAMVLAVSFIYLLVILCALYPGREAAAIYPAIALHED
ncbi:FtsX-like permease family protein [uncultured Chitinophaga sp.]|uniref:ABC transporter permease n=1 Tax=uncultured Chitinophaga sp. TaxID=339340 RepID=UPI0025CF11AE|nr:FtsX-like permease family protein [uncultured Chitinophaga sp.]